LGVINNIDDYLKSTNRKISIHPGPGPCYDFVANGCNSKKSTWIVPHVIKSRDDSEIITWRCNWGTICESSCLYAINKNNKVDNIQTPYLE
jgi:hypothetical protein